MLSGGGYWSHSTAQFYATISLTAGVHSMQFSTFPVNDQIAAHRVAHHHSLGGRPIVQVAPHAITAPRHLSI